MLLQTNKTPVKLLIIDDEKDYCLLLHRFFLNRGFEVTICHTLNEGLITLSSRTFNILILDNDLPDGLGWNHANFIASNYADLKLALISAHPRKHNLPLPKTAMVWEKPISMLELTKIAESHANSEGE